MNKFKILFCFLFLIISILAVDDIVTIDNGQIVGNIYENARGFLGIPYAQAPVGNLRWAPPVKALPWKPKVLWGKTFQCGCPQSCNLPPHTCPTNTSEDCLTLNVWTPLQQTPNQQLPVFVFIPGGRFEQGTAGTILYDGRIFVNTTNTIMVTINYRLGVLGWLFDGDQITGNYGLMDQQMAFSWVRDNIAAFGGNPQNITIGGQSAGASSVGCHMITPTSKGLFSKAIAESNPWSLPLKTFSEAKELAKLLKTFLSCDQNDYNCLRNKSADEIVKGQDAVQNHFNLFTPLSLFMPWTPVVGTDYMPYQFVEAFDKGAFNNVPFMLGSVANESVIFIDEAFKKVSLELYLGFVTDVFNVHAFDVLLTYPVHLFGDRYDLLMSYLGTHYIFTCPTRKIARDSSAKGGQTYLYWFDHVLSFGAKAWGPNFTFCDDMVCHASELPFIFDCAHDANYTMTKDEVRLSNTIINYWSNFVKSGNPNTPVTPQLTWPDRKSVV